MKKIINLFIAFILVLTTITSASALTTNIFWDDNTNQTSVMNSNEASYYVHILPDFNANEIQVTSTLYNLNTGQLVGTVYSNTFQITNPNQYITITDSITQNEYLTEGNFLLNVNVLQNSDVVTQRSKVLNLEVTSYVAPANINADFTFTPTNPTTNNIVTFTDQSTADNQIVLYEWFVNNQKVGEGQTLLRTFTNQGTYNVSLKITDNQGNTDEITKNVVVSNPVFTGPTANFIFNPENPFVSDQVTFTSTSAQGDSSIVSYNWNINGAPINQNNSFFTWTFNYASSFEVSLTVIDANGLSDEMTKTVVVSNQPIQNILIDELGCNANVVQGQTQHCSVHTSSNSQSEEGVQVTFRYQGTNEVLGTCVTNDKGYCHITPIINKNPGVYTVYAEATKQGFTPDNSRSLTTQFTVWESRYEILALTLYEDAYLTENYTFYRSNPIYASFSIRDTFTNQVLSPNTNLVSEVFIRVNNQNELQFNKDTFTSSQFRYNLPMIPLSDDFLGQGQVFSFVFNFTDNTAGQDQVVVNILNNELQFNPPSSFEMEVGESLTVDFKQFVSDIETPSNEVQFTFSNLGTMQVQDLGNNVFRFTAPNTELRQFVSVTADDTDGSTVTRQIIFDIVDNSVVSGPTADFVFSPANPVVNENILFTSTSTQGDTPIVSYEWVIDGVIVSTTNAVSWSTNTPGTRSATLTVTDQNGLSSSITRNVVVSSTTVPTGPTADFDNFPKSVMRVGIYTNLVSLSTPGSSPIVLYEWFANGQKIGEGENLSYMLTQEGQLNITHTVTDQNGLSDSITKTFTIAPPSLLLEELGCNANVVQGNMQYCSAYVSSGNEDVEGAQVTFRYAHNDQILGTCTTNFKGYCSITPTINLPVGTYEVYADATKQGLVSDNSRTLRSQFDVWAHRYDIENLRVFSDAFITEKYTFYRGTSVYASFTVRDTFTNQIISPNQGLLSEVFIRVNNQNELYFTSIAHSTEYRYRLNALPLSDDFLGQGQVFSFVFNFTDNTAGQDQVVVNILNNELQFNPPSQIQVPSGGSLDLDFKQFVFDIETPSNEVQFTFNNLGSLQVQNLGNNVFRFTAPLQEFTQNISVTADDTDGSAVTRSMNVVVLDTQNLLGPVAVLQMPGAALANTDVLLDASNSYARSGTLTLYTFEIFRFGEKIHEYTTTEDFTTHTFQEKGAHTVTLTVTDSAGRQDSTSLQIDIGRNNPDIVIGDYEGLHISNIRVAGIDNGIIDINEPYAVYATITNNRNERINNLRLSFTIPELGFRIQGSSFDLSPGQSTQRQIVGYLPFNKEDLYQEDFIVTVGVSGSGFSRNRYVPVDIGVY
jgi:PKD repeat protein